MPPLPLGLILQAGLPRLSPEGRALINALASCGGRIGSAHDLALCVGLRSRFCLARLLRREGLPPIGQLADWTCVLQLLREAEVTGQSLQRLARRGDLNPTTCYRLFKRTTGLPWATARARGFAWALLRFLGHCRTPSGPSPARLESVAPDRASASCRGPGRCWNGVSQRGARAPRARHPEGVVAATLPLSGAPFDVAISPAGTTYVTRIHAAAVDRLDLGLLQLVTSVSVGSVPTQVTFDRASRWAYVTNQFSDSIGVIDVATSRQSEVIPVADDPYRALLAPDDQTLFVSTNADSLYRINLASKAVTARLGLAAAANGLTLSADGSRLYASTLAGTITEISVAGNAVLRTFPVGGFLQGVAVSPDGRELYVADEVGWRLIVWSLVTGQPLDRIPLGGGGFDVRLTPDGAQVYVSLPSAGQVLVLDRASHRPLKTIATGGTPRRIAFDRSGVTAVVANEAGWVSFIN